MDLIPFVNQPFVRSRRNNYIDFLLCAFWLLPPPSTPLLTSVICDLDIISVIVIWDLTPSFGDGE